MVKSNPFYELYLAERLPSSEFVSLFSPVLIPHVQLLFQPGNVVITGMIGSGKSMLLKLMQLETRLMYQDERVEFPVHKSLRKFITCGINLAHSSAVDFGYRSYKGVEAAEVEGLFGDYINSVLVSSLLDNLARLSCEEVKGLHAEVGFSLSNASLDQLVGQLVSGDFWHGWFVGLSDFESFRTRMQHRTKMYRSFFARRLRELPQDLLETRSVVGEQMGELVEQLKALSILDPDTSVFVDIDQYEELEKIASQAECERPVDYRSVIHRALASRDPRISFRIGARRHSWRSHLRIMGSEGRLEEDRDYKYVNLDEVFKREENRKTYIFPEFADDICRRRILSAGLTLDDSSPALRQLYGNSLKAEDKAKSYYGDASGKHLTATDKILSLEASWSNATKQKLLSLCKTDPLSARLGEAWIRQKGEPLKFSAESKELLWQKAIYWKKERSEVAQLQIASRLHERPIFSGMQEILDLSGTNILTFISINQHIWDTYLRYQVGSRSINRSATLIDQSFQKVGIFRASEHWFKRIPEETGKSTDRAKFLEALSRYLRVKLIADQKLSYPGASGFSLTVEELNQIPGLKYLLNELADYGNLLESHHTTKESNRARRVKWYLNPIICPFLGLPYKRVKEPLYSSVRELIGIVVEAKVNIGDFVNVQNDQQSLF